MQLLLLIWFVVLPAVATAQVSHAAISPPSVLGGQTHAWLIMPDHSSRPGSGLNVLVHFPPQDDASQDLLASAQLARTINDRPMAITARDSEVLIALRGVGPDQSEVIRVQGLRAVQRGIGWAYKPTSRFDPYTVLASDGIVTSMAASAQLVVVVVEDDDGRAAVHVLLRGAWTEFTGIAQSASSVHRVWSSSEGIMVATTDREQTTLSTLRLIDGDLVLDGSSVMEVLPAASEVWSVGSGNYVFERGDGVGRVSALDAGQLAVLVDLPLGDRTGVVPVFAQGPRVVTLQWERQEVDGRPAAMATLHARDVSLGTGAVLFEGPLPSRDVFTRDEFRLLALIVTAVVIAVLVVVLKGDLDDDAISIPPLYVLAEPSRRFAATGVDFAVAVAIVSALYGINYRTLLSLQVLIMPGDAWTSIPAVFLCGGVIGTVSEWWAARTIGKWMTGARIVRVGIPPEQAFSIGLRRALIRNTIKWLMPPVAALAMVDRNGRHRGDQLAKVAVVVRVEPEGPETES